MDESSNERPIIIKKVKKGGGGGHHGGAWKVAYADFVTAMMAFFMLMWLLNATTEKQRKGISDYFTPTVSISRVSGGGEGNFGGDSVFTENSLARNGQGATLQAPADADKSKGLEDSEEESQETERLMMIEEALMGVGGESLVDDNLLKHIVTKVTDEGLVIELFDFDGIRLFDEDEPTIMLRQLAHLILQSAKDTPNDLAIEGHLASEPVVMAQSDLWERSSKRAQGMRRLFMEIGMPLGRVNRVTGHADREPARPDPLLSRNNRLEIILLREN